MIHEISAGTIGNINDIVNEAEEFARLNEQYMELLAKNCGKTAKQLKEAFKDKRDLYFNPQDAVKFGIADHVGIPAIRKHVQFDLQFPKHKRFRK
jgi:ATP-dependent Clp protease protease subunit